MAVQKPKISSPENSTATLNSGTLANEKSQGSFPPPPKSHTLLSSLPVWVAGPLQSPRAWKVLVRCWVATLASFIILLPNASLRTIGVTCDIHPFSASILTNAVEKGVLRAPDKPITATVSSCAAHDFRMCFSNIAPALSSLTIIEAVVHSGCWSALWMGDRYRCNARCGRRAKSGAHPSGGGADSSKVGFQVYCSFEPL